MTALVWNQAGQNRYEFGVDRGVFYDSGNVGHVWNGLLKVNEVTKGGTAQEYHYDGVKYLDTISPGNYSSSISSYAPPPVFLEASGERAVVPGFILTRQVRSLFGLSYRTFIGPELGYKIHIVYNALASPTQRDHTTVDSDVDPEVLTWRIDAVPPVRSKYRPSAHYILDSTKMLPDALETIEDILYGTETTPSRLPDPGELENIAILWQPMVIDPRPSTGLALLVSGMGDLYRVDIEGFLRALPNTRLIQTPTLGIYRLE